MTEHNAELLSRIVDEEGVAAILEELAIRCEAKGKIIQHLRARATWLVVMDQLRYSVARLRKNC